MFRCYLHPSSGAQLQRTAIGFVWFGVFIPLEQVLVWGTFTLEQGQLQTHLKEECLQIYNKLNASKLPLERALNRHKTVNIPQIPGHTNYGRSVRQLFPSNTSLRFSSDMTVATIEQFQIYVHCV
jgi:hypothetical protein